MHERRGEREALPLTTRKFRAARVRRSRKVERLENLINIRRRNIENTRDSPHMLHKSHLREKCRRLMLNTDPPKQLWIARSRIRIEKPNRARSGLAETHERIEQRCFARPIRADYPRKAPFSTSRLRPFKMRISPIVTVSSRAQTAVASARPFSRNNGCDLSLRGRGARRKGPPASRLERRPRRAHTAQQGRYRRLRGPASASCTWIHPFSSAALMSRVACEA